MFIIMSLQKAEWNLWEYGSHLSALWLVFFFLTAVCRQRDPARNGGLVQLMCETLIVGSFAKLFYLQFAHSLVFVYVLCLLSLSLYLFFLPAWNECKWVLQKPFSNSKGPWVGSAASISGIPTDSTIKVKTDHIILENNCLSVIRGIGCLLCKASQLY